MRVNSTTDGRFLAELTRRQTIFSNFMESFNTGVALPPVMVRYNRRIEALESAINKEPETSNAQVKHTPATEKPVDVDSLIETVDEPPVTECPHRARIEATIKEMRDRINKLNGIVDDKNKEIARLNTSIVQLNASLEDTVKRVHELSKQMQDHVSFVPSEAASTPQKEISVDTSVFATKDELKSTEKRIVKELTDKIDAELIDAEERFDEKIKASIETIKLALDETVGEEEDGEEDDEEEDLEAVIDMD